jgi:hypothetical protein
MRATHLLALLVFVLLAVGVAFAQDASPPKPSASADQFDLLKKPSDGLAIDGYRLPAEFDWIKALTPYEIPNLRFPPAAVCLSMRTYRMRRVRRDSDVTEPDGYTTCQPAAQYSVRNADAPASR